MQVLFFFFLKIGYDDRCCECKIATVLLNSCSVYCAELFCEVLRIEKICENPIVFLQQEKSKD